MRYKSLSLSWPLADVQYLFLEPSCGFVRLLSRRRDSDVREWATFARCHTSYWGDHWHRTLGVLWAVMTGKRAWSHHVWTLKCYVCMLPCLHWHLHSAPKAAESLSVFEIQVWGGFVETCAPCEERCSKLFVWNWWLIKRTWWELLMLRAKQWLLTIWNSKLAPSAGTNGYDKLRINCACAVYRCKCGFESSAAAAFHKHLTSFKGMHPLMQSLYQSSVRLLICTVLQVC